MEFKFYDTKPNHCPTEIEIISGRESIQHNGIEYLTIDTDSLKERLFAIKYACTSGPFKAVKVSGNILAVGLHEYFYLYDLERKQNILTHYLDMFNHLSVDEGLFYATNISGVTCFDTSGKMIWENQDYLAEDGVILHEFSENEILGTGCFDPLAPDGWKDFILDKKTGEVKFHQRHEEIKR